MDLSTTTQTTEDAGLEPVSKPIARVVSALALGVEEREGTAALAEAETRPALSPHHQHRLNLLRSMAASAVYSHDGTLLGWKDAVNGNFTRASDEDRALLAGRAPVSRPAGQAVAEDKARLQAAQERLVPGIADLVAKRGRR